MNGAYLLKMKVLVTTSAVFVFVISKLFSNLSLILIFTPPIVFGVITLLLNKFRYKIAFYHDFPNTLRLFFACAGGVLLNPLNLSYLLGGLILIFVGFFANDEAMRRLYRQKGVIVLSGIDGTGKTTHAARIAKWLASKGLKCEILPFHRYLFVDKLSRMKLKVSKTKVQRDIPAKTGRLSVIRPYLSLVDNLLLYFLRVVPNVAKNKWTVCDRFIWDNYVKYKALDYNLKGLDKLCFLIRPRIGIVLDIPSKKARERIKKRLEHIQYTEEQFEIERKEFLRLANENGYLVVQTTKPFKEVEKRINLYLRTFQE